MRSCPATQLLSNGGYHVMVSDAGGGYSRCNDSALTRWREDATRDQWGMFVYIRDVSTHDLWSAARQPVCNRSAVYSADFSGTMATLGSDAYGVRSRVDIVVAGDSDVELRRITVTNQTNQPKELDLTSYAEVVLANAATDDAHPAFSKLFVQTEILAAGDAIICHRRSGGETRNEPWMVHMVLPGGPCHISAETDRMRFIGRGSTVARPQALRQGGVLSGTQGSVLDPCVAIRCPVTLSAGQSSTITYLLGAAESRGACLALIKKYRQPLAIEHSFQTALDYEARGLRDLALNAQQARLYDRIADSIIYGNAALRADADIIAQNRRGQSGLWGFSVSGDLPIVLVQLGMSSDLTLARELIQAHAYWRLKGLPVDLVIFNAENVAGNPQRQQQVEALVASGGGALSERGGVFVDLQSILQTADRVLFQAVARVVFTHGGGSLAAQVERSATPVVAPPAALVARDAASPREARGPATPAIADDRPGDLQFDNGLGGFSADGREYIITLDPEETTPAPWINVLANPLFGTLVSESGCANTWSENAHEFLLTPWSNDPVSDSQGEAFYLRDDDTGVVWSPTPWPCRGAGRYVCRHGFGYSVFSHTQDGIESELTVYVAPDAPVKFAALEVRNRSGEDRRLSATGYVEWVLGDLRSKTMMHVTTRQDPESGAVVAGNPYSADFGTRRAFFMVDGVGQSCTADRSEFLGRNGSPQNPAAMKADRLSGNTGAALDPCAAIRVPFELDDGAQRTLVFRLGAGAGDDEVHALIKRFNDADAARTALTDVRRYWTHTLGTVSIESPDAALNCLSNGWLLYQVMACRLWGRTAFYQSSGAFGYRDQLQDVMALVHAQPGLVRAHLLLCASRQYLEGDVQHWWHPPVGRGVRTRCSDDYLWLPFAACRYVSVTGDTGILDEQVDFLRGRALRPDEESYYELPDPADAAAPLYEHCVRAIENGLRFGSHGLPLMGTGDWNDGMNKVGAQGKGESVWLAFFLHTVLTQFSDIARARGDITFAARCLHEAASLERNTEQHGWDGAWFRRGYFDDGTPLGAAKNSECQIDSIAQSWAVLSGVAAPERAGKAMQAVDERLVDRTGAIIKLLAPPFDTSVPDPGYIKAYVPGVRENGGQYTHAAIWSIMAFAALGDRARAWELLSIVNPVNHATNRAGADLYKVEPYVVASDVYSLAPHTGRGGWTWYSGSAGWLYRLIIESVLGLCRKGSMLYVEPCIPECWDSFTIRYRYGAATYSILVQQHTGKRTGARLLIDGIASQESAISLRDDGREHRVQVRVFRGDTLSGDR